MAFAPAAMTVRGPHTASPDGGVTFWGDGSVALRLYLASGPAEIAVEARGSEVAGEAPQLEVRLDGRAVGRIAVTSPGLRSYSVTADVRHAAEAALEIAFINYRDGGAPLASRVVHVRRVAVRSPAD